MVIDNGIEESWMSPAAQKVIKKINSGKSVSIPAPLNIEYPTSDLTPSEVKEKVLEVAQRVTNFRVEAHRLAGENESRRVLDKIKYSSEEDFGKLPPQNPRFKTIMENGIVDGEPTTVTKVSKPSKADIEKYEQDLKKWREDLADWQSRTHYARANNILSYYTPVSRKTFIEDVMSMYDIPYSEAAALKAKLLTMSVYHPKVF